jgi:hypothetical protein
MFLSATIEDKPVSRAYTPVSSDDDVGHFDLVVKVYPNGMLPWAIFILKLRADVSHDFFILLSTDRLCLSP